MDKRDVGELCDIVNSGMYIRSFLWEKEYSVEDACVQDNLTMIFDKEISFLSEKVLKVKFYEVEKLICEDIFNCIFMPTITIEDMSVRGYETCSYFVQDAEDMFYFYCRDIEYYWDQY